MICRSRCRLGCELEGHVQPAGMGPHLEPTINPSIPFTPVGPLPQQQRGIQNARTIPPRPRPWSGQLASLPQLVPAVPDHRGSRGHGLLFLRRRDGRRRAAFNQTGIDRVAGVHKSEGASLAGSDPEVWSSEGTLGLGLSGELPTAASTLGGATVPSHWKKPDIRSPTSLGSRPRVGLPTLSCSPGPPTIC